MPALNYSYAAFRGTKRPHDLNDPPLGQLLGLANNKCEWPSYKGRSTHTNGQCAKQNNEVFKAFKAGGKLPGSSKPMTSGANRDAVHPGRRSYLAGVDDSVTNDGDPQIKRVMQFTSSSFTT
ncbi:uncharacterized protein MYCGRDRAFT_81070, partial [Zymoseptoria tritici IPO323]